MKLFTKLSHALAQGRKHRSSVKIELFDNHYTTRGEIKKNPLERAVLMGYSYIQIVIFTKLFLIEP